MQNGTGQATPPKYLVYVVTKLKRSIYSNTVVRVPCLVKYGSYTAVAHNQSSYIAVHDAYM